MQLVLECHLNGTFRCFCCLTGINNLSGMSAGVIGLSNALRIILSSRAAHRNALLDRRCTGWATDQLALKRWHYDDGD